MARSAHEFEAQCPRPARFGGFGVQVHIAEGAEEPNPTRVRQGGPERPEQQPTAFASQRQVETSVSPLDGSQKPTALRSTCPPCPGRGGRVRHSKKCRY